MNVLGLVSVVLFIIIVYLFFRMRTMLKGVPGARSDMNTMELIRNWQHSKAEQSQEQEILREEARELAKKEIRNTLIQRYKQEEIAKATETKSDRAKTIFKEGLGIDSDKVFSRENMDRVTNNRGINKLDPGVKSSEIFSSQRIGKMAGKNSMDQDRIKSAAGNIHWDKGVRRGLDTGSTFTGLERALGKNNKKRR